MSLADREQVCI